MRTRLYRDHVVVCGLEAGWALTRMLRARNERVVVIERDPAHPRIEACRSDHVPVFVGDARDEHVLRRAGITRARRLFVVCGDDAVNMKVAEQARRIVAGQRRPSAGRSARRLDVLVHVADPYLSGLLTMQEMERRDRDDVRLDFFSLYAGGARALLSQYPLAALGAGLDDARHMMVIGLGRLGRQLVVQAARNWGADEHRADERLWITVADVQAEDRLVALRQQHPFLETTCKLNQVDLAPDPLHILHSSVFDVPGCPPVSHVFVCLPDDAQGLGVGLALSRTLKHRDIPIVVRTYDADVAALLPSVAAADGAGLYVFDQMDRTCRPDQLFAGVHETVARAIHDTWVRQQRAAGRTAADSPLMVEWEQLPKPAKESNRGQAEHIPVKLAAVGCEMGPLTEREAELFAFGPAELELLAQMEHARWMAQARADHPANVPWEVLSEEMREIDRNFVRRMPALLASVGFQVNRIEGGDTESSPSRNGRPLVAAR
jgi:voltage-gated potassium channel Kch